MMTIQRERERKKNRKNFISNNFSLFLSLEWIKREKLKTEVEDRLQNKNGRETRNFDLFSSIYVIKVIRDEHLNFGHCVFSVFFVFFFCIYV